MAANSRTHRSTTTAHSIAGQPNNEPPEYGPEDDDDWRDDEDGDNEEAHEDGQEDVEEDDEDEFDDVNEDDDGEVELEGRPEWTAPVAKSVPFVVPKMNEGDLRKTILNIMSEPGLDTKEKARRVQV